jgi:hypothetical protein
MSRSGRALPSGLQELLHRAARDEELRQQLADTSFPKGRGARWCRFALVLVPST